MAAAPKKTTSSNKATVYIDVDDEITHIIDKVNASDKKIVALVLPKRASVLQSIVNMKLLKKAAQNAKKNLVLITSETGLLPLAGAAGLHVAKSLQSKPEIPPTPHRTLDESDTEEITEEGADPAIDTSASVGALAALHGQDDETETIELDTVKLDDPDSTKKTAKGKKQRHLKVPNFERFRLGIVLAVLGVLLLIGGWVLAAVVLPRATITIQTDTTTVVSSFDFTASVNQSELDEDARRIPATLKEVRKTDSEKVPATGERDDGTKASGEVTLSIPCGSVSGGPAVVPAGTAVSTAGLNYITQTSATLNESSFSPCRFSKTVDVRAAQNGEGHNISSGKTFSVAGNSSISGRNADDIDGGTSKIVKIVAQKDIDDALAKITERQSSGATDEIEALLVADGLFPLRETLKAGDPAVTAAPEVDKEATEVTVSSEILYSMLGINRDDLSAVIARDVQDDIDSERQAITDDGIQTAIIRINNNPNPGEAFINFRTSVTAGPEINTEALKEAVRGKKRGEVEQYINALPGVKDVLVEYSPFWVYQTPNAASKITVLIEDPAANQTNSTGSNGQ